MSDVDNPVQTSGDNPGPRGHEKVIPIRPDVDAAATPEDGPSLQDLALTDVDTFGGLVVDWFEQRKHDLKNLLAIPAGMEVELSDNTDPTVPEKSMVLDGDKLVAFRLGVQSAMAVLGELPFGRVSIATGEEVDVATGQPASDTAVNTEVTNDKPD